MISPSFHIICQQKNHRNHQSSGHPHSFCYIINAMGAVPWGASGHGESSRVFGGKHGIPARKQKPTYSHHATLPRPSGAQSDSIFPRAGWGVFFFWWERNYQFTGWSLGWRLFFFQKKHTLVSESFIAKSMDELFVGLKVFGLVSDCCRKLHCWWVSWILSINLCHSEDQRWDVETVEMFFFFFWKYWFWEFDMQPQNFSRYPSIYIILEHDNTDHVHTCFPPQLHIDSLLWRSRGKYMLPQRYLIAAVPEKYSSAMSLSLCNILYKVGAWWYIYIYTYLGYSLPHGYLLCEKRCPFDKVMQVAELAEFSKFYILLPRNSLKYIWWNWKTTIKSSSLPGYTS